MFCLYTLPLARPAQAKIQMLTAICSIVKLISLSKMQSLQTKSIVTSRLEPGIYKLLYEGEIGHLYTGTFWGNVDFLISNTHEYSQLYGIYFYVFSIHSFGLL